MTGVYYLWMCMSEKGKEVIQIMVLSDYKWWSYTKNKRCIRFAVCLLIYNWYTPDTHIMSWPLLLTYCQSNTKLWGEGREELCYSVLFYSKENTTWHMMLLYTILQYSKHHMTHDVTVYYSTVKKTPLDTWRYYVLFYSKENTSWRMMLLCTILQ